MDKERINIFLVGKPSHDLISPALLDSIDIATTLTLFKDTADIPSVESGIKADAIFIDLTVTKENNFKNLRELRVLKRLKKIPIVVFSDSTYLEDITEAFDCGANMYVPKIIFKKNKITSLKTIFRLNWRTDLLLKDKGLFVLAEVNKLIKLNSY